MSYKDVLLKTVTGMDFGSPLYLVFFVTNRCNARCAHCFYLKHLNDPARAELTINDIERITLSVGSLFTVNLTGGEPFLRDDLADIAQLFFKNTGIRTLGLVTNGLLTEKIIQSVSGILRVCPGLVVDVAVSIDGIGDEHDRFRGVPGIFDAACRTLNALAAIKNKDLVRGVSMVVAPENQHTIMRTYEVVSTKLKPDYIAPLVLRGPLTNSDVGKIDKSIYERLCIKIASDVKLGSRTRFLSSLVTARDIVSRKAVLNGRSGPLLRCFAGSLTGMINERGDVFPCEQFPDKIGNLRDVGYDFRALWTGAEALRIRKLIRDVQCSCTHECFFNSNMLFNKKNWPVILCEMIALRHRDQKSSE